MSQKRIPRRLRKMKKKFPLSLRLSAKPSRSVLSSRTIVLLEMTYSGVDNPVPDQRILGAVPGMPMLPDGSSI